MSKQATKLQTNLSSIHINRFAPFIEVHTIDEIHTIHFSNVNDKDNNQFYITNRNNIMRLEHFGNAKLQHTNYWDKHILD